MISYALDVEMYLFLPFCVFYSVYVAFSSDGVYVGVGMITGSVAVYISFSLQVNILYLF